MHDHASHNPTHPHNHNHLPMGDKIKRAFLFGIGLNVVFVVVEFLVGFLYHSMGLLADAGHNLGDVGSLVISLVAFYLAKKRVTKHYSYGFRKATVHASLMNAVILLVAVGAIILECISKLRNPGEVSSWPIIITAGIGVVINGLTVFLFTRDKERDLNIKGAYLHMLADTLVSVGVVLSGVVILFTGWTILDPIIGLGIALVILYSTWGLLKESIRLSLDGIPGNIEPQEICEHLMENENVAEIHHLHIWAISTTENALTAHVVLKHVEQMEQTREALHHELSEHGIAHATLEFEVAGSHCEMKSCEAPNA